MGEVGKTWSKHSQKVEKEPEIKKPEKPKKKDKKALLKEIIGDHKDDPKFQEFMQAHDSKRNLWGNDEELAGVKEEETKKDEEKDEGNFY